MSKIKQKNNKINKLDMENKIYENPLTTRYASEEMNYIFSPEFKFTTWRHLWVSLAKAEKALGLKISDKQIKDLEKYQDKLNIDVALKKEKEIRHDVMSHIYAYGEQAKSAKGIIHLGATSCFVGDNTDIIVYRQALNIIKIKLIEVIRLLKKFSLKYKYLPTLAWTHFQPAQPTTVGKRATLWLNDIIYDFNDINYVIDSLEFLGCKGTTGTQASFLDLFEGDEKKCKKLDLLISKDFNFKNVVKVSGQTYSRKQDYKILSCLSSIAISAHKFTNDLRLLQHLKEVEEPFESMQVGSSAMPYKRNPMRSERIASLSDFVMSLSASTMIVASTQWFERTLDDSANKRLSIPQSFLAVDGILNLYINIIDNLVVNQKIISKHLNEELPFMVSENIMMEEVKKGKDRQKIHEKIRKLSIIAGNNVKKEGKENNLIDLILNDKDFSFTKDELEKLLDPKKYIGLSEKQVEDFIKNTVDVILNKYKNVKINKIKINV